MSSNERLTQEYKEKYFNTDKYKIAIKWRGNTYYDKDRVIPAQAFSPLLELDGVQFYSFQTFEGSEETEKLHNIIDIGSDLIDFGQTAAALNNVDLVICNDTSLVHLAGGLGIPCLAMLPWEVNWRWHDNLDKCDWYDSVKLYRQKTDGDWNGVISEIKGELEKLLS